MSKQQTITINDVVYDTHTGLRISGPAQAPATPPKKRTIAVTSDVSSAKPRAAVAAKAVHGVKRKNSTTLNRAYVKTPAKATTPTAHNVKPAKTLPARSPMIQKFAPSHTSAKAAPAAASRKKSAVDIGPQPHTVKHVAPKPVQKHVAHSSAPSSQDIKNRAVSQALANAKPNTKQVKSSFAKRHARLANIATASLALVLLAGYFTYMNLPHLSFRVAASQAGIAAHYPSYTPAGYSLKGPIAYKDGEVRIQYASNTNPQGITVTQSKSSWDSSALLDNYVQYESHGNYTTYHDSGLTIYVYDNHAAWVNAGVLHTINSDAQLSNDQVRHMATSM